MIDTYVSQNTVWHSNNFINVKGHNSALDMGKYESQ